MTPRVKPSCVPPFPRKARGRGWGILFYVLLSSVVASAECVPYDQAKSLEGKPGCVTGKVVKVSHSQSGNLYLDFCTNYRECAFTVYVPRSDAEKLGDLKPLEGQQVEIYGKVQDYNGRAEIILKDKRQLEGERTKYVPPDKELRPDDSHSAEFHATGHHPKTGREQHASSKRSSGSSTSKTTAPSTTAPVARPQ